jgi:hypothetical protein
MTKPNVDVNVDHQELSFIIIRKCKMAQPLWKTIWWFLAKLNILLPYNLAILFLDIYPNEFKIYAHTKAYT